MLTKGKIALAIIIVVLAPTIGPLQKYWTERSQSKEDYNRFLKWRKEAGLDEDDRRQELKKRNALYPDPASRYLTNGINPERLRILDDTTNIFRRVVTDEHSGQYALLTTCGIFALREVDGSTKYCEDISDWFRGGSATNIWSMKKSLEALPYLLVIGLEFYANDPIIIGPHRYQDRGRIFINLTNGYICYGPM